MWIVPSYSRVILWKAFIIFCHKCVFRPFAYYIEIRGIVPYRDCKGGNNTQFSYLSDCSLRIFFGCLKIEQVEGEKSVV